MMRTRKATHPLLIVGQIDRGLLEGDERSAGWLAGVGRRVQSRRVARQVRYEHEGGYLLRRRSLVLADGTASWNWTRRSDALC